MPLSHSQSRDTRWEYVPSQPVPCFSGLRSKRGLEPCPAAMEDAQFYEQMHLPAKRVCLRDFNSQQFDHDMNEGLPGCLKDFPSTTHQSPIPVGSSSNRAGPRTTTPTFLPSMVDGYHNNYNNHHSSSSINNNNILHSSPSSSSSTLPPITEDKSLDNLNTSDNNNNSGNDDLMMEDDDSGFTAAAATATTTTTIGSSSSTSTIYPNMYNDNYNHISQSSTLTNNRDGMMCNGNIGDSDSNTGSMETDSETQQQNSHNASVAGAISSSSSSSSSSLSSSSPKTSSAAYCGYSSCRGLKPSPVSGRPFCHCSASWRGMYGMEGAYFNDYY